MAQICRLAPLLHDRLDLWDCECSGLVELVASPFNLELNVARANRVPSKPFSTDYVPHRSIVLTDSARRYPADQDGKAAQ